MGPVTLHAVTRFCSAWLLLVNVAWVSASPAVKYDQSQTGEYNVQIHLKNLELYALLDESILNAEYDYDYADLTEKPPKPTPSPPSPESSTSNLDCVEMTKYGVVYRKNSTRCANMSAIAAAFGSNTPSKPAAGSTVAPSGAYAGSNGNSVTSTTSTTTTSTTTEAAVTTPSSPPPTPSYALQPEVGTFALKKCGIGYFRDNLGRCRRIRKPHLPFLHMIHTPGVIKSFNGDVASKLPSTTPSGPHK